MPFKWPIASVVSIKYTPHVANCCWTICAVQYIESKRNIISFGAKNTPKPYQVPPSERMCVCARLWMLWVCESVTSWLKYRYEKILPIAPFTDANTQLNFRLPILVNFHTFCFPFAYTCMCVLACVWVCLKLATLKPYSCLEFVPLQSANGLNTAYAWYRWLKLIVWL